MRVICAQLLPLAPLVAVAFLVLAAGMLPLMLVLACASLGEDFLARPMKRPFRLHSRYGKLLGWYMALILLTLVVLLGLMLLAIVCDVDAGGEPLGHGARIVLVIMASAVLSVVSIVTWKLIAMGRGLPKLYVGVDELLVILRGRKTSIPLDCIETILRHGGLIRIVFTPESGFGEPLLAELRGAHVRKAILKRDDIPWLEQIVETEGLDLVELTQEEWESELKSS